ncbi:MAG: alpha/beta fold hydrolase, partial [Caulobacteraceae bacterium]
SADLLAVLLRGSNGIGPLMTTVINRRMLSLGLGGIAAAGLAGAGAQAQAQTQAPTQAKTSRAPYQGPPQPWTGGGFVQRAGGRLHYVTLGEDASGRPPVVLLHKLGGWVSDWRLVAPAMAKGRKLIAFDLPGHGDSHFDGPPPYVQTLGETAALIVGALDELDVQQFDLVGTSLGGCLSVPLAAYWPERVRRLALVSSALGGPHTIAQIKATIDVTEKKIFDADGHPLPFEGGVLTKTFGMVHADSMTAEGNASRVRADLWLQPSERGVALADIVGTLKRIECPTLLLYGDKDPAYTKFRVAAEAQLKHGQTEFVPNSGAFVMLDNPEPTAIILNRFLDKA